MTTVACSETIDAPAGVALGAEPKTPEAAFERLTNEGLTCAVQMNILELDDTGLARLGSMAQTHLTAEERGELLDGKEANCGLQPQVSDSNLASTAQAITGTYTVVNIPETSGSGGYYPSYLSRDSAFYSWMCNSGAPENPADWILQYHVPGAYSHLSGLKIRGTNSIGSCYTANPTGSRVYSDDDIRTCVGFWQALLCGVTPTTYETVIWW